MPRNNILLFIIISFVSIFIASKTSIRDQIFQSVINLIDTSSYNAPSENLIREGAMIGALASVDDYPYTAYIPPASQDEYLMEIQGQYAGVGLSFLFRDTKSRELYFIPLRNSPASRAGLKFGDRLVEISGRPVEALTSEDVLTSLKGEAGTSVDIKIRTRESIDQFNKIETATLSNNRDLINSSALSGVKDLSLTREVIQQEVVKGNHLNSTGDWSFVLNTNNQIGYIAIEQFTDLTTPLTLAALDQLKGLNVSKLILDFRGNPGGFLPDAVAICNELLAYGTPIVETRFPRGDRRLFESHNAHAPNFKIVVLVDEDSASASEIVAAALQDAGVGIVVGNRSYGKGTIQSLFELPFHSGSVRMTTASFWRPSGKRIHRSKQNAEEDWGVSPTDGFNIPMEPWQKVYQKWVRALYDSETNFDPETHRKLCLAMESVLKDVCESLHLSTDEEKREKLAELGITQDCIERYRNLLKVDSSAEDSPETNASSTEASFTPVGNFPFFDPQLDKAIEYLESIQ